MLLGIVCTWTSWWKRQTLKDRYLYQSSEEQQISQKFIKQHTFICFVFCFQETFNYMFIQLSYELLFRE
jgi:hypothetical protein